MDLLVLPSQISYWDFDGLIGHLAKVRTTDLLVEPYLRCYRYGCWQDDTGVEYVLV